MDKVKRSISVKQQAKDESLRLLIENIKLEHPFWGYRRIWAWLKYHNGHAINRKRVQRLIQLHNLGVKRSELKAKRTANRSKPQATKPNEFWGIDMTKTITKFGWVYIVLVVDWYSKKIVGYEIDNRSKTLHWKRALNMGLNNCFEDGVRDKGLHLVSDNGSQPTSTSFIKECGNLDIEQIFTSYNNPKLAMDVRNIVSNSHVRCFTSRPKPRSKR